MPSILTPPHLPPSLPVQSNLPPLPPMPPLTPMQADSHIQFLQNQVNTFKEQIQQSEKNLNAQKENMKTTKKVDF
jgi:hypothetical protein